MSATGEQAPLVPALDGFDSIKLIGLGGVGGIVARYLTVFLTALDADIRLVFVDGDTFESRNAERMVFAHAGNKAAVLRDELTVHTVESRVTMVAVEEYVQPDNLDRLVRDRDLVLLAVDNHATRKLVSEHCSGLRNVCLISGGNDGAGADSSGRERRGTYGNVQMYMRREGEDRTPALTRHHPEIAEPADSMPHELSCQELYESVPQILFANLATASALLNTLFLVACDADHYDELHLDIHDGLMRPASFGPRPTVTPS
ncbi:MAG: ThiF family adenylyltransferase [Planctomycetota bacterium]